MASLGIFHQTHTYAAAWAPESDLIRFLAIACPILSIMTYVSPVVSVVEMVKSSDATHFPIQVVAAQAAQNIASAAYGLHIKNEPFYISSFVGLVFQLSWIAVWFSVVRRDSKHRFMRSLHPLFAALVMVSTAASTIYVLLWLDREFVGSLSCGMTLLLCIAPLSKLGLVVRSMNSASIPLVMSIVMLITNVTWAVYGLLLHDIFMVLPSLFGLIITIFQLLVTAWCNGLLFYDLAFLKWLYRGYETVPAAESAPRSSSVTFGLDEDRETI